MFFFLYVFNYLFINIMIIVIKETNIRKGIQVLRNRPKLYANKENKYYNKEK